MKNFLLFLVLLLNREKSILEIIKNQEKAIWITGFKTGKLRINYYRPGKCIWHGSAPIRKTGIFSYTTYIRYPGFSPESELPLLDYLRKVL